MLSLLALPSPLHPAVVHFPIVLILLGTAVAVVAAFVRRWHLPSIAASLLILGAAGAALAMQTGEKEGELAGEAPGVESVLDLHEDWAERTQVVSLLVAVLALGAALASRWKAAGRTLSALTAAGALSAAWCVAQTGHYGGQLVFRHGAGVNLVAGAQPAGATLPPKSPSRDHDDD